MPPLHGPVPGIARSLEVAAAAGGVVAASELERYSEPLRVLQFNVLADGLAQNGEFLKCEPVHLEFAYRRPMLEAEIFGLQPHVIGLQEVNRYDDWLREALQARGYESHFLQKSPSPCEKFGFPADGCVLAWDAARFELVQLNASSYEGCTQGSIVATLKERSENGRMLVAATTHLKAKPEGAPVRRAQARELGKRLAAAVATVEGAGAKADVVLTGDFNEEGGEGVLTALNDGYGDAGGGAFTNVFSDASPNGGFSTWKYRPGKEAGSVKEKREWIDFILFRGAMSVGSRLSMPTTAQIGDGALPSREYPSDHLAVGASLNWGPY